MWPRWFNTGLPSPKRRTTVLVAPVAFEAPITHASDIYSFDDVPSADNGPYLLTQLIDEVVVRAQRVLTEELAKRAEFEVIPFDEARRLTTGSSATLRRKWTEEE